MSEDPTLAASALIDARRGTDGWFRANCPYCLERTGKDDRRQSLGIKPEIMFFTCFKCGARGRLREEDIGVQVWRPVVVDDDGKKLDLGPPEGYEELGSDDAWTSIFLAAPRRYVEGRGITRQTVIEAGIGAACDGYHAGRIIVPTFDLDGRTWLGFVGRDWTNKHPLRYRYPRGMPRAKFLYNQVALYVPTDEPVLVVEGVFDALPFWPNVVACLGKPGEIHRRLLAEATRPIAVCLDGDAHNEGWALSEWLRLYGRRAGAVRLPPGRDPNTVESSWLRDEAIKCIR